MNFKKYTDNQVGWLKSYTDAEIKAIREAVKVVAETSTAKFESQNEWRGQMKDQVEKFVRQDSLEALRDVLIRQMDAQKENFAKQLEAKEAEIQDLKAFNIKWANRIWGIAAGLGILEILLKYVFK